MVGDVNSAEVKVVLGRERSSNGREYIVLSIDNDGVPMELFGFWQSKAMKKPFMIDDDGEIVERKPKHTGGKPPYVMLMVQEIEKLRGNPEVKSLEEVIGFAVLLGRNVEWHTGRLKRAKGKESLKYADMVNIYSGTKRNLNRIIKEMKLLGILRHEKDGYYISSQYVKKGKTKKVDEIITTDD
jgi:hypothetical protein